MRAIVIAAVLASSLSCGPHDGGTAAADRIFLNARFFTVDDTRPWAEAIAVTSGRIVYVGDEAGAREHQDTSTEILDLNGKFVLPGFQDAHIHPLEGASLETFFGCRLETLSQDESDPEKWLDELTKCDELERPIEWVLGGGHDLAQLAHLERMPKELLDDVFPDVPVALMEKSSHSFWVNSAALTRAGITRDTPDPQGGIIIKDPKTGEPNGILTDSAGDEIAHLALSQTPELQEARYEALLLSQGMMASVGITSATNARVYWERGNAEPWLRAEREGTLKTRSVMAIWAYPHMDDDSQLETIRSMYRDELYQGDNPSLLRWSQVKFYSDGTVSNNSAAVLDPYMRFAHPDLERNPLGLNYFTEERLGHYITELERVGFDVHIHALGDRATRECLNAIELARTRNAGDVTERRHQLTHLSLVAESDVPRFAELGVVPNIQITYGDGEETAGQAEGDDGWFSIVGNTGSLYAPVIQLHDAGARVVISSDWDVAPMSPLVALQTMIEQSEGVWTKDQALEFAIRAYTLNAAYAMRHDSVTGSIEVGKFADLVVLDENLFEIPAARIRHIPVAATYLAGEVVFVREE